MGGFRSKPKKPPEQRITEQDRAVLKLKGCRDQLQLEKKRIERQIEAQKAVVRRLLSEGNKDKAKLLLARKRLLETRFSQTDSQLSNLMDQIGQLEDVQIQMRVVDALKTGNEALNAIHTIFKLEDVEKIVGETAEAVEYQREIDALIAGTFTQADRSEIERELDELLSEEDSAIASLPDAPTREPEAAGQAQAQAQAQAATHSDQAAKQKSTRQAVAAM